MKLSRMRSGLALVALAASTSTAARADDAASELAFKPSVAKVRIELSRKHVAVVHEINLARGAFHGEDSDVFVAFGAPGVPRAIEATLVAVRRGELEARTEERGTPLVWRYATKRPAASLPLVGRSTMAGVSIQLPGAIAESALGRSNMATLRVRTLYALAPSRDRDLVVRLGETPNGALATGRIEVFATEDAALERAEARYCGEASTGPELSMRIVGTKSARHESGAAPIVTPREAGDDLCVRLVSK